MTLRGVLSEVLRNVSTGAARSVLWAIVSGVILTILTAADAALVFQIEREAVLFQTAAANVRRLATSGQIDGVACDALVDVSTVEASGSIRDIDPITIGEAPGLPLTAFEVSTGLGAVIGIDNPEPVGVWMEERLATALKLSQGDTLTTVRSAMRIAAVFTWPDDGRDARFGFSILVPQAPIAPFDECWLRAWPVVDDNDRLLRSTVLVASAPAFTQIAQLNGNLGAALDANREFRERVTFHILWISPVVMLTIGFTSSRLRRLEYAAALHAGQARGALLLGACIEAFVWASTGASIAVVFDMVGLRIMGVAQASSLWLICVRVVLLSHFGAISGAVVSAALVRERQLFHYFRSR